MVKAWEWVRRRPLTLGIIIFFAGWYVLQLSVLSFFGADVARFWFYIEKPPNVVSPGILLGPISHDITSPTHIGANILFLLIAGGFAEPYIGQKKILYLIFGLGYLGTYLANITAFIHQFWVLAGASGGVLALWAYSGIKLRHKAYDYGTGLEFSRDGIERITAFVLILGIPAFFLHEGVLAAQVQSGHVIGLLLGCLYFGYEQSSIRSGEWVDEANLTALLFRLRTGRYRRAVGVGIGFTGAVLLFVGGYIVGPWLEGVASFLVSLLFLQGDLTVLWSVHATIIALSLVGLSFAWNSVRNLPTRDAIIAEIAYRLRSIETITFLLTANLLVGAGVLLTTDNVVTSSVGGAVGALLIGSIVVTVRRFWIVFDLLLHNTLDEKVFDFSDDALSGRSRGTESEYDEYLGHFFDGCHVEVDRDRPERLREQFRGVETLLDKLFATDSSLKNDSQFWNYVFGSYDAVYRRCVAQQNPELERQVIKSLSGVYRKTLRQGDSDLVLSSFQCISKLFIRGYSMEPGANSTEFLLERFENAQRGVLSEFARVDDPESLSNAFRLVDGMLETHTVLWRTAVEHEAVGALGYLRHMLDDVFQFRRYEHAPPPDVRERRNIPEDSVAARKQDRADIYRESVRQLRYAAYGWAFNLYEEGEGSDEFIQHVFAECVEQDFGSVNELSDLYFKMRDATEPLNYWERWNLDREMSQNYGVATTGMSIHTWLLRFYCAALIWLLDKRDAIENLQGRDPATSPLTEYERVQTDVDRITGQIETYQEDFPLANFLNGDPSIADRCDALIDYFEEVESVLDEQEQARIREMPVSEESDSGFEKHVNSQLESADFRTAIETIGNITLVDELEEEETNVTFSVESTAPRELFVDDGRETVFQSRHHELIDRYRRLVLDHLSFAEREVSSAAEIPDALADLISDEEVALIVCEHMDVGRVLRDDERSKRSSNDDVPGSYFSFLDVPVLRDVTTEFAAVAFFEDGFVYEEEDGNGPISLNVTAGENVDDWDDEELPDDQDIRDHARIELSYNAHIEGSGRNGVIFRISD